MKMNAGHRGREQESGFQRAWVAVATMAALFAVGGCVPGASTPSPSPTSRTGSATPSPAVTSSPSPLDAATYPNLPRFSYPYDRFAYKSAYSECRLFGVAGATEVFGGDSNDPSSVAQAYAVATFPSSEEHREPTFQGCLDAFETRTNELGSTVLGVIPARV